MNQHEKFKSCSYCGQKSEPELVCCEHCGAPLPEYPREMWRSEPFPYNGYVVWGLRETEFRFDQVSYYFYLGDRLVDVVMVDRDVIKSFVPEAYDPMDFIFSLFELSQGKEEVLRVVEENTMRPATFEIRRIDLDHNKGLTIEQYYQAYHKK